jgi:hypothetical protein
MKVYVYPESSQNIPDLFFNNGKNRGFTFFNEINPGFSSKMANPAISRVYILAISEYLIGR